ncbi:MAG TPA: ADP-ribosylglycohydrolase family protein [Candidatus Wallbacteria bacterium]|nr:ADP-ribosylglycohydrolase family protein [Candidatus Wallbacteria bacterium]
MESLKIKDGIIGLAVGDAIGVPVEFKPRIFLRRSPVVEMAGYGTHSQPAGTWSDDSSMVFCTMESLCGGYSVKDIAKKFCSWISEGLWTPYGNVFDAGITTRSALDKVSRGIEPPFCGESGEQSNGNGSLMRILPLAYYFFCDDIYKRLGAVHEVSEITHSHMRSKIGCTIFIELVINLIKGYSKAEALENTCRAILDFYKRADDKSELEAYFRILSRGIVKVPEAKIKSSGYIVDTLEAAIWCLFNSSSYSEAVLRAVNLGEDTDTVGAVTGALAATYYGYGDIPEKWTSSLARKEEIFALIGRFEQKVTSETV